jgi:hypothetical protein
MRRRITHYPSGYSVCARPSRAVRFGCRATAGELWLNAVTSLLVNDRRQCRLGQGTVGASPR